MTITVKMLAFGTNGIRTVEIPDNQAKKVDDVHDLLELAFYFGQNDFQPKPMRSVSVGDVVILPNGKGNWRVAGVGWEKVEEVV